MKRWGIFEVIVLPKKNYRNRDCAVPIFFVLGLYLGIIERS